MLWFSKLLELELNPEGYTEGNRKGVMAGAEKPRELREEQDFSNPSWKADINDLHSTLDTALTVGVGVHGCSRSD